MTAGEVATTTGLGRASVSITLSKLAKGGEVIKAARGYQLAGQTPAGARPTPLVEVTGRCGCLAASSAESEQSAG
jgi:hypothetical protein